MRIKHYIFSLSVLMLLVSGCGNKVGVDPITSILQEHTALTARVDSLSKALTTEKEQRRLAAIKDTSTQETFRALHQNSPLISDHLRNAKLLLNNSYNEVVLAERNGIRSSQLRQSWELTKTDIDKHLVSATSLFPGSGSIAQPIETAQENTPANEGTVVNPPTNAEVHKPAQNQRNTNQNDGNEENWPVYNPEYISPEPPPLREEESTNAPEGSEEDNESSSSESEEQPQSDESENNDEQDTENNEDQ